MEKEILVDTDILADERHRQRKFSRIYRIITAILLLAACVGLVYAGFLSSVRSGWVVLIGILAVVAVIDRVPVCEHCLPLRRAVLARMARARRSAGAPLTVADRRALAECDR